DQVQAIAQESSSNSVPWKRHGRERGPQIRCGIVNFQRSERSQKLRRLNLATRHINAAVVGRKPSATACGRHASLLRAPLVGCGIVLLDDVEVAGDSNERLSDAAADH